MCLNLMVQLSLWLMQFLLSFVCDKSPNFYSCEALNGKFFVFLFCCCCFFWNRHLFTSPLPPLSCQPFTYSKCFQSPVNLFTKSLSDLLAWSPPLLTRLKKNAGRSPLECWECESLGSLNFPSASRARHEPSQDKESPLTCDVIRHVRAFLKYFILNLLVDNNFATCVC